MKNATRLARYLVAAAVILLTTSPANAKKGRAPKNTENDKSDSATVDQPAAMEGLADSFYLKSSVTLHRRSVDNHSVKSFDGSVRCLFEKTARVNMFSSDEYTPSADGSSVVDTEGNEFPLNVWEGPCEDDNHSVHVTMDEAGSKSYIVVTGVDNDDTHYQPVGNGSDDFYVYTDSMMKDTSDPNVHVFGNDLNFQAPTFVEVVEDHESEFVEGGSRRLPQLSASDTVSLRGISNKRQLAEVCTNKGSNDGNQCDCYRGLKIAIVYDASFCAIFGSNQNAIIQIEDIVSRASKEYENAMCVKLEIGAVKNIDTENDTPNGSGRCEVDYENDSYSDMNRDNLCPTNGKDTDHWLNDFTNHMNSSNQLGGGLATTHLFSGYTAKNAVGCAWIGRSCDDHYAYGINLMDWTNNQAARTAVFAHELGHNLGCEHNYAQGKIMSGEVGADSQGFGNACRTRVQSTIQSKTCDYHVDRVYKTGPIVPSPTPQINSPPVLIKQKISQGKMMDVDDPSLPWN